MSGIDRIAAERNRQISREGWTPEHDDGHIADELAWAAVCYAAPLPLFANVERYRPCSCREACCQHIGGEVRLRQPCDPWPWEGEGDKRDKHDRLRRLEIAGALIAAEIDRLIRVGSKP